MREAILAACGEYPDNIDVTVKVITTGYTRSYSSSQIKIEKVEATPTLTAMLLLALYWPGPYPRWKKEGAQCHTGNLSRDILIEISQIHLLKIRTSETHHGHTLKDVTKQILGKCQSMGDITVDGDSIRDTLELIEKGSWDDLLCKEL